MRLVRVLVSEAHREDWLDALDDRGIDYVVTSDASNGGEAVLVEFPLPTPAVEAVMDELREAGLGEDYTVITSAETVTTANFAELEERFADEDDSIDRAEIRTRADGMTPDSRTYYGMTLISAIVATAGLLLDSPAIVVGAMVIAPQVGAALTASTGTVLNDREMIARGFRALVAGLVVAILGAAAFGWLVRTTSIVPATLNVTTVTQVTHRISPGMLTVVVGAGAGGAAAFGLATAFPISIVGVMIAAALIPAAAAVGVGIAWGIPSVALGAFVLLIVNAALVTLAAIAVLWWLGYRPADWTDRPLRKRTLPAFGPPLVLLTVLLCLLAGSGAVIAGEIAFENEVNRGVEEVLAQDAYDRVELVDVQTRFADGDLSSGDRRISVVLSRPADVAYPDLPTALAARIEERTGTAVAVEIEYRETVSAGT
ncbi:TIGR00341 family protein [Halalkalicoccus jeotgali]|uniref:TIGR00341 family protein n=1 Tax=Halalkalicoccus jeotgali (strain DSM 18796 / CECT 7217 / JCM 14584 / KCTC 4019 / B3) TaxID=795797 RepID=D8J6D4_HALJB|nr:TIGR00341 family protein [Halalkalicoccus jeotgali]ADJ15852.1 hypothetical protein HacjB3_12345 [Halalkalicoccus jeotgali B3]ELY37948.1 hypothetical protein C497_07539 [Halalkalicoccus jeotgali B3]